MIRAAGIVFRSKADGRILFLQRGAGGDCSGMWVPPGGKLEGDETPEQAAVRESGEEAGPQAKKAAKNLKLLARRVASVAPTPLDVPDAPTTVAVRDDAVDYTTFLVEVDEPFDITIDDESVGYAWATAEQPPEPLHPGARVALAKLSANELDVARMMAAGDLTSPQFYANVMLLDIRITGTGYAYRKAHDEFCYRAPENYLTPEFLARCNGLPVLWEHPERATLTSKEWGDRAVGTTFLPYIKGEEVWGVVKIYDQMAIDELTNGEEWSTSPTVDFGAGVVLQNTCETLTLDDGTKVLVEGKAPLLDHIAICSKGVWDKGGAPVGVNTARADVQMADEDDKKREDQAKADKAKADADEQRWSKIMDSLGSVSKVADAVDDLRKRMDAWDDEKKSDKAKADKAKSDADEEAKKANEAANEPGAGDDGEVERKAKSDKAKADEDEEQKKSDKAKADKAKADKAKADEDEKKREDAVKADSEDRAKMQREIDDLKRMVAASNRSDEDFNAIGAAQARADAAYQQFGKQAPRPYSGETTLGYRRRIANDLKAHSKNWKDTDFTRIDHEGTFATIESGIYADAVLAARDPASFTDGELRQVVVPDAYGVGKRVEFYGDPSWWMDDFKQKPMRAKFLRPRQN